MAICFISLNGNINFFLKTKQNKNIINDARKNLHESETDSGTIPN